MTHSEAHARTVPHLDEGQRRTTPQRDAGAQGHHRSYQDGKKKTDVHYDNGAVGFELVSGRTYQSHYREIV